MRHNDIYLSVFRHSSLKGPSLSSQCCSLNIISVRRTEGPRENPTSFRNPWRVSIVGTLRTIILYNCGHVKNCTCAMINFKVAIFGGYTIIMHVCYFCGFRPQNTKYCTSTPKRKLCRETGLPEWCCTALYTTL